jgi:hypothetical protein
VPDRAIIPLLPALSIGFIAGIIAAALQLTSGAALAVGIAGGIVVAIAALSSVLGVSGDPQEKTIVAGQRAALAVALYASMFLFIQGFLREGEASSLIWLVLGIVLAIVLTQLRVRDRGELQTSTD